MKAKSCLCTLLLALAAILSASSHTGPGSAYPPKSVTGATDPAVTQETIHQTVCVPNYTTRVRAVSEKTKRAVLDRDGQTEAGCCEVDHFLSLEIGGSNDADKNLWAQPYAGEFGARVKDVVETALHRKLCSDQMTLKEVQSCVTSDWIACGRKIGVIR